jgi:hypothetical protein
VDSHCEGPQGFALLSGQITSAPTWFGNTKPPIGTKPALRSVPGQPKVHQIAGVAFPARGSKLLPLSRLASRSTGPTLVVSYASHDLEESPGTRCSGALGHRASPLGAPHRVLRLAADERTSRLHWVPQIPVSAGAIAINDLTPSSRSCRRSPYASAPRPPWPQRPPPINVRAALGELRPAFDRHWHETAAFATVDRLPHGGINLPLTFRGDANAAARVCRGAGNGCCSSALAGCATGVGNVHSRCLIRHPVGERLNQKSGAKAVITAHAPLPH